jgi:phage N-6-adenine-methyltransferase
MEARGHQLIPFLQQLPSDWSAVRKEIAEMEDIRAIVAAEKRVKALAEIIQAETKSNADAFGLAVCALDLMARAGEVIEDMQAKGELAKRGRPKKTDNLSVLSEILRCDYEAANKRSSRYKTAAKASRDDYYASLDQEKDKPSYSGFVAFHGIGVNLKATQGRKQNEWYTPKEYIEAARKVMGSIDLDPASSKIANEIVQAATFYTASENGLDYKWAGNVFMNPPFEAKLAIAFINKLCDHYEAGDVAQAILLTNNNTDTTWWHRATNSGQVVCFTAGRVAFYDPSGNESQPTNGHTLTYFGKRVGSFAKVFSEFGTCMRVYE